LKLKGTLRFRFTSLRSPSLNKDYKENCSTRNFPKFFFHFVPEKLLLSLMLCKIRLPPLLLRSRGTAHFAQYVRLPAAVMPCTRPRSARTRVHRTTAAYPKLSAHKLHFVSFLICQLRIKRTHYMKCNFLYPIIKYNE